MGLVELLFLGVGLSMDAFAVSICKGIETKKAKIEEIKQYDTVILGGGIY